MSQTQEIDVRELINSRPVGIFQKWIVFLGFVIIVLDGFDAVIMGFIAPQLKVDWGIGNQELGAVLSAGLIGQAIGAMLAGPLADRYGRKIVLVISVCSFGIWTLATAFATDITMMVVLRVLTGLGLGAAIPNTSTLIAEYSPERARSFLVTLTLCGFTCGAASGGFISAWMIPAFGWESVLILGGGLPVLLSLVLCFKMPESVSFLVSKHAHLDRVRAVLSRLAPDVAISGTSFSLGRPSEENRSSIGIVLSRQYRQGTFTLWAGYFLILFLIYLLSSWLPTLIKEGGGYSVSDAAIATAMFQIGGQGGALTLGWAMDRWHKARVLMVTFLLGGVAIFAIGQFTQQYVLLCSIAFCVGFCMIGGSVGMNALAADFYPTEARSTGSSWMIGFGRVGAILSAFAGAQILAQGWSLSQVFAGLIIPALLSALAMYIHGLKSTSPHRRLSMGVI
ncbi:TPA: MFS transporter [Pseudomonas aeruginosa]|uniref:MFS transporter n=1 Tax=Pseudomonas aeruginosa TaxID=287 RepID=UPI000EB20E03|nr:aromatic acid/H+ symport family MFS transporter [Pseudomonas aeruginosa]